MEPVSNDENNYPKSLGRLGYNTAYKNTIQFNKNNLSKKLARTPLKSKLNLMNSSQEQNSIKNQNEKMLKYPLLKSISSSNINFKNKKNISYAINNDDTYNYDEEDEYNKDALPDEIEDFMHIHENEIIMKNDIDDIDMNKATEYKKNDMKILDKSFRLSMDMIIMCSERISMKMMETIIIQIVMNLIVKKNLMSISKNQMI